MHPSIRALAAVVFSAAILMPLLHTVGSHAVLLGASSDEIQTGSAGASVVEPAAPCSLCLAARSPRDAGPVALAPERPVDSLRVRPGARFELTFRSTALAGRVEPRAPPAFHV